LRPGGAVGGESRSVPRGGPHPRGKPALRQSQPEMRTATRPPRPLRRDRRSERHPGTADGHAVGPESLGRSAHIARHRRAIGFAVPAGGGGGRQPGDGGASPAMLTYSLHGVTLESRFVFQNRLVPMEGRPDLVFTCCIGPLPPPPEELLWPRDGPGDITLYRTSDATVLRFADISCFALRAGRIDACLARREQLHLVEIQLFGMVLALWLEQRGVPVLHGAAVAPGDRAVAFLGSGGAGKTSMTASFLQVGAGLLTEDLLALEPTPGAVLAHPGHPQLRMWPDGARHFLRRSDGLAIVHPAFAKLRVPIGEPMIGELASRPLPLGAVYILERQAAGTGPS